MTAPRLALATLACFALLAAGAGSALGAVRYASPTGSGPEPCSPAPCSLSKAIDGAVDGDQVVLAPGQYAVASEVVIAKAIEVGGEAGANRPSVGLEGGGWVVKNPGALVHDLDLTITKPAMAYVLSLEGGTVERIVAHAGLGIGCEVSDGLFRDSLCPDGLQASAYDPGPHHISLRNLTTGPLLVGAGAGTAVTVDAVNVIAHSFDPGDEDVEVDVSAGGSGTFTFANSNYATVGTTLSTGTEYTYTAPGTNGNQTAPPQFVDPAAGNFHVLEGSPTVDAGLVDPLIGALELDGNGRSLPKLPCGAGVPDIGAYEFVPAACPTPAPAPSPSNAFRFGKLKRLKKKGIALLTVWVPGPGRLALAGKGLVPRKARHVAGPGKTKLRLVAKGKWKRALLRKGKVKLRARVTYVPDGGVARTTVRKLKLAKKLR